jgi:hypothetical protein
MERASNQVLKNTRALEFFTERGGKVLETEHGWCNYYIMPSGIAYLENFHIYKEFRNKQNGTSLLMRLETQLKEIEGVDFYTTTISTEFGDRDRALFICLKRGFKFHGSTQEAIYLKKEID